MKPLSLLFLGLVFPTLVQATSPKLNSTTPAGGQRGTEVELRFNGQRLDDAQEIIFYSPGLEVAKIASAKTNSVKALVRIAPDCRLGEHQLRIRTASGVSDLRTFYVGANAHLAEVEPNNDVAKAQAVPLNVTVTGGAGQEDVDYFQVAAKKGDRISVEVEAMRLGRTMIDTYLAIHDQSGKILASSDDTVLLMQDSALSMIAPEEGNYVVQIRETSYGGAADSAYRLHIGTFPRPTAVFPAGGKAGDAVAVKFIGDAGGEFTQQVKLPAQPGEKFGAFAERDGQFAPSPNWMRVSSFPNVLEAEPNNAKEQATEADGDLPLALNGILSKDGEADWFRFKAKKGQALDISLYARRLRSPLDSVLHLYDAKGASLAQNDDSAGADSYVKFTVSADGEYLLRVTDHLGKGGPDFTYRIEITPVQPSLTLSIPQVARNDSQTRQYIAVPRGNRFATMIAVKRNNFSGDLVLGMEGLPAGVKLQANTMVAKIDAMPVVFEAASDAAIGGKLLELTAKPAEAAKDVGSSFRHDLEFVSGPNNTYYYQTRADKLYVAVTEAAPYSLQIVEPKVPLVQAGTMDLKIVAERKPGFDEAINLKMMWNPPGLGSQPDITIPKGTNSAIYQLNASASAQLEKWKIAVLGSATVNGGTLNVSSSLTSLEVAEPFVAGKIETVFVEPGRTTNLVCKLDQKKPFKGKATVKLMGLPEKVVSPEMQISQDDKEVVFKLTIDPKCPTGSHKNLFCSVDIQQDSQSIPHSIGAGGILRIVPPKKKTEETKVAAKSDRTAN